MTYKIDEDMATADVAIKIKAKDLQELFLDGATAVADQSANTKTIAKAIEKEIKLNNADIEQLFFDFIEELIFIKDRESMVFNSFDVLVKEKKDGFYVICTAHGDKIDHKKQELHTDVKAITMHLFEVEELDDDQGWTAMFILDI